MPDFSQPTRQSYSAIIFIILRFLRRGIKSFWPILLIILINRRRANFIELLPAIILGIVLPFQLIIGILAYFRYYYYVQGDELVIEKGIFVKTKLNIPFERIQTIDFNQSILHRMFDVVGLQLDTAGSAGKEADIQALSRERAEALRTFILDQKALRKEESTEEDLEKDILTSSDAQELIFEHSIVDLLKTGLTQNHLRTMGIVLAFLGSGLQYIEQITGDEFYESLESMLGIETDVFWIVMLITLPILIIVSFSFTLLSTAYRFFGLQVWKTRSGFRVVSGLLNRVERAASLQKVQLMYWTVNPIQKWVDMATFKVFQLSSTGAQLVGKKAIVLPGCYPPNLKAMIDMHLPAHWREKLERHTISRLIIFRRILFRGILPAVALSLALFAPMGMASLWFLLWIPYSILAAFLYYRHFYWELNQEVIHTHRGIWTIRQHLLPIHKIVSVNLHQSPYQRRKNLYNINLFTAAGEITIPYVSREKALAVYNYILYEVETA